ncbi:unnamed protein product [Cylicostephanus goldi]|uniref:Uncharacterized protein n=1 Tax=Cylicostephanus goldi TaxID=71465 RepID=A0A3P6SR96_CYLGO|nr:unnamed protein product [Cylicostephanus goldi]
MITSNQPEQMKETCDDGDQYVLRRSKVQQKPVTTLSEFKLPIGRGRLTKVNANGKPFMMSVSATSFSNCTTKTDDMAAVEN